MRIALVGPTHPQTGGIAHHTTELAHRLHDAGHQLDLVAWSAQYPRWLYPGTQRVPGGVPEVTVYPGVSHPLAWWRPDSWWRTGRRLRGYDVVVIVHATTVQIPAYLVLTVALRFGALARGRRRPGLVVVCHNVLPHERHLGDVALTRALLGGADALVLHSAEQAKAAGAFTRASLSVANLPPHPPRSPSGELRMVEPDGGGPDGGGPDGRQANGAGPDGHQPDGARPPYRQLVFFGTVRPYKGLDVLLRALAEVPGVGLTVAGDFWTPVAVFARLVDAHGLGDRVVLRPGYVAAAEIPELFRDVDALVLPYRSGTASQNVALAHALGVPVIATKVGALAIHVRDGVDGILVEPDSVADLVLGLHRFYTPGMPKQLRAAVRPQDAEGAWKRYLEALESALVAAAGMPSSSSQGARRRAGVRAPGRPR